MKGIMIQGTASDVGKSLLATAICRLIADRGYDVVPFKAQTMTTETVLIDGKTMSRTQYEQAVAAHRKPHPWMNPVLLKPLKDLKSEVFFQGESQGAIQGNMYKDHYYEHARAVISTSLIEVGRRSEYVVIEGAGSPVEMNLKERDLSNMAIAELADVPVLLVADIDKGGVFASIVGTLALLTERERQRVQGILINKFHGEPDHFSDGVRWLETYTRLPVLGVIPYIDYEVDEGELCARNDATSRLKELEYEKLATHVEAHIDTEKLFYLLRGGKR